MYLYKSYVCVKILCDKPPQGSGYTEVNIYLSFVHVPASCLKFSWLKTGSGWACCQCYIELFYLNLLPQLLGEVAN